ncbi:cache domain-containing sensor histidine kinase [Enterococcus villorum]|uniref:Histidine kinase n=2 Tax=Enterococcus villorum TaxID=112904 RepID=A0A511IZ65_9ENTE|nr:sensor histidine kinase [Enterococcus villorum]EOH87430.1 hypothetical protein UAO_02141 [Enterococcus villorum ATCC 700913]EOW77851.1 hypothetical protein I591_00705 [Enterococcus villorum ATCC 700913]GEL91025.1 histidine kinase [Enterococcus villorum]
MKKKFKEYELFTKLLIILFIALFTQAMIISFFIYDRSKNAYINLFDKSNELALGKIQRDFAILNDNIENTLTVIADNPAVENYFSKKNQTSLMNFNQLKEIQQMNRSFTIISPYINYDLMIFGENGRTFIGNDMIAKLNASTFFQSQVIKKVSANQAATQMIFVDFGLTTRDQAAHSILFIKKLTTAFNHIYGYAVIAITSDEFANLFNDTIHSEISKIYLVNDSNEIIASNETSLIGNKTDLLKDLTSNETKTIGHNRLTRVPLYRQNSALISKIDIHSLTNQMGVVFPIILFNFITVIIVGSVVFSSMNHQTKSIYALIHSLKHIKNIPNRTQINVQGTYETKILGTTINQLLTTIDENYMISIENEKKKRKLEIQTMQAQIHPHFIYNTLTSLKFLIWQKENQKAINGIDNFIDLLRSTIGKKDELITVKEELKSVKSYVNILTLRYGEDISTRFMIPDELLFYKVPNMMIQPIIENAYMYAFQNKKVGFITLFGKMNKNQLFFEIVDNGDGFDTNKKENGKDYFSGIGIKNVNERIQLLYGQDYGVHIHSIIGSGTTVTIVLPLLE